MGPNNMSPEFFINGRQTDVHAQGDTPISNPADGSVVAKVLEASAQTVDAAVEAARAAQSAWAERSHADRGQVLHAGAEAIRAHIADLAPLITSEVGKPLLESKRELLRCAATLEHYAGLGKAVRGGHIPGLDEDAFGMVLRSPIGVVGAILPWNFPTTLLANKLGPALLMGNAMVAKPAPSTPLATLRVAEILSEAGLPDGVFNVVTGGTDVGIAMVDHPRIGKIGFTGSTAAGKAIWARAGDSLKRITLELGGSDPLIIMADADLPAAVSAASVGRFFNCGQACLATKRLFVAREVADEVVEALVKKVSRLTVGSPTSDGTRLGPMHNERQRAILEDQIRDAQESGGELLAGGQRPNDAVLAGGSFYEPTLVLEPGRESKMATQEVFGPALPIWRFDTLDEAIAAANNSPYGLGSSIWTRDLTSAITAAERLRTGYTWINSVNKVYDELPFGGVKESGYGKEHGAEALDFYSESKSVVVKI